MSEQNERPDPWAPPEDRVPLEKSGTPSGAPGAPGASVPPVHGQPTVTSMPGVNDSAPRGAGEGQVPPPPVAPGGPVGPAGPVAPEAYGYPGYPGYPGYSAGPGGPGAPVGTGGPGFPSYPGAAGYGSQGAWGIVPAPANGMGVAALVLGIISVVGFCLYGLGVILGILALIFGIIGRGKAQRGEADNGGMALAGIILGIVGVVVSAAFLALMVWGIQNGKFDEEGDARGAVSSVAARG